MSTSQNKTTQPVTAPPSLLGTASAGKPPQFPPQTGAFQTAVKKDVLETKAKEEEELRAAQDKKIASPFSQVMLTQPGAPKPGALDPKAAPQTNDITLHKCDILALYGATCSCTVFCFNCSMVAPCFPPIEALAKLASKIRGGLWRAATIF